MVVMVVMVAMVVMVGCLTKLCRATRTCICWVYCHAICFFQAAHEYLPNICRILPICIVAVPYIAILNCLSVATIRPSPQM